MIRAGGSHSDHPDVVGVVLAGSAYRGDGAFERLLRTHLLSVAQRPIISYALSWLQAGGVQHVVVCTDNATEALRERLGDGTSFGLRLQYLEDDQPRGPAGCVYDVAQRVGADRFVVVEGSIIPQFGLFEVLAGHIGRTALATTVVETERRRATIAREQSRIPGGVYVLERRSLEHISPVGYQDIKQGLLERLYARGERVFSHDVPGVSPRILNFDSYTAVSGWLVAVAARRPDWFPDYVPLNDGARHPSARIHADARLIGPVLVGPDAQIDSGAVVVGPTSVGFGSHVHSGALVARSFVWDRCVVGAGALVDSCLLADDVVVPAGGRWHDAVEILDSRGDQRSAATAASSDEPVRLPTGAGLPRGLSAPPIPAPLAHEGMG